MEFNNIEKWASQGQPQLLEFARYAAIVEDQAGRAGAGFNDVTWESDERVGNFDHCVVATCHEPGKADLERYPEYGNSFPDDALLSEEWLYVFSPWGFEICRKECLSTSVIVCTD